MEELYGDATRGGEWAAVRLEVSGQSIVRADAPGLERDLVGLTLLQASAVSGETLAADALANAIGPVVAAPPEPGRIAVAMSGGVDSAAALLAARDRAVGVTLRLWVDPSASAGERVCCSPQAVIAARETCHRLGVPHVTLDLREQFRETVVSPFIRSYAAGETPNPCVRCNGSFRFDELLAFADRIGAERLSTGHYARIVPRGDRLAIARAADSSKDQSYMLATVDPSVLGRLVFPLGEQTKTVTRATVAAAGLPAATKSESQEACFLGGDDYRAFLERSGATPAPGAIVDVAGATVGAHTGHWRFTPGQRKGLGVSAPEPLYALRTIAGSNTVVVGPRSALARTRVVVRGRLDEPCTTAVVKLRYRSAPVSTAVTPTEDGFELHLDEPAYGVAPGQTAVLYLDDAIVGAGVIVQAEQ